MRVLVLGGSGFLGRHVVAGLLARGHAVVVGSRDPRRAQLRMQPAAQSCERRVVRFERMITPHDWDATLAGIDAVVNCVGILRPRGRASYERVHHLAPAALAAACTRRGLRRFVHVSALGLTDGARSGFIRSKLAGERALAAAGAVSIVRPSLLDGDGGFGARWIRKVARWPVHCVPSDATGRIAVLDVRDAGIAIAALCEVDDAPEWREVELGGTEAWSIAEYLAATRAAAALAPAQRAIVPAWCARLASHVFDLLHLTPFSFGHLELLRRDNLPRPNRLPALLGRAPTPVAQAQRRPDGRRISPAASAD